MTDAPAAIPSARRAWSEAAFAFALLFALYLIPWRGTWPTPASFTSRDSLGNRLLAASLMSRGSLDIAPYFASPPSGQLAEHVLAPDASGRLAPKFPVGTAILALPFFAGVPPDHAACAVAPYWRSLAVREHVAAAFLAALAAAFFHVVVRTRLPFALSARAGWIATFALGVGSPFWSANALALWSHNGSALCFAALALAATKPGGAMASARRFAFVGALAAMAAWCRPSHLPTLILVPLAAAFARDPRRDGEDAPRFDRALAMARLKWCAIGAAPVLALAGGFNMALYDGDPLGPYLRGIVALGAKGEAAGQEAAPAWEAPLGSLFSPGAGLFFACPFFLLAFGGIAAAARRMELLGWLALGIVGSQAFLIWRNPIWWGGWCWGPRLFADLAPWLLLVCAPTLAKLAAGGRLYLAGALALIGAFGQWVGVARFDYGWFFERPDWAQIRADLWTTSHSPLADALRRGRPDGVPEAENGDWQTQRFAPPDWMADAMGVASSGERERRLDAAQPSLARDEGVWRWLGGYSPTGPLPRGPLWEPRWEGGFQYRDRVWIPLAGLPKAERVRWLMLAFPAGSAPARLVSGAAAERVAIDPPAGSEAARWSLALWRVELDPEARYVVVERPRPPTLNDPLATVPTVEMIGGPVFLSEAE